MFQLVKQFSNVQIVYLVRDNELSPIYWFDTRIKILASEWKNEVSGYGMYCSFRCGLHVGGGQVKCGGAILQSKLTGVADWFRSFDPSSFSTLPASSNS
jgi:hypothetical protein